MQEIFKLSVADPECLSPIPDPDFFTYPGSRIQKPQPKRGVKKNLLSNHFLLQITQNWKLFYFWTVENKIWANFQRIIWLFIQKIVTKLSQYGFGIRDSGKTYPGSQTRGQKGTGSRIQDPQHCLNYYETKKEHLENVQTCRGPYLDLNLFCTM